MRDTKKGKTGNGRGLSAVSRQTRERKSERSRPNEAGGKVRFGEKSRPNHLFADGGKK